MGSLQLPFITTLIMKVGAALVFLFISQSLGGVLRPCSDLTPGQNPCLGEYYYSITGDVSKDGKFDVDVKKSGEEPTKPTEPTTTPSGSGKTYFIPSLLFVCALSVLVF